ncbi:hypothetical protein BKA63DRAFT_595851 [Paraphoma chrysanthemicola]|nr:hypothetical protein BKA63DRAFT_595851 [Paraphoma chrysanthemicola]
MACPTFRFLDLPVELRMIVYESVGFSSRKRILEKSASGLKDYFWPPGPEGASESSITLIVPTMSLGLLSTCRSVHKEAKDIFAKKLAALRKLPMRYIVDWSAAVALMSPWSPLFHHSCPEVDFPNASGSNNTTESFISSLGSFLKDMTTGHDISIDMVLDHEDHLSYGTEIGKALILMAQYRQDNGYLFDVVCKSKLPKWRDCYGIVGSPSLTRSYLERLQMGMNTGPGPSNHQCSRYAVNLMPVSGDTFKGYLERYGTY